jgi:hypothetical protein
MPQSDIGHWKCSFEFEPSKWFGFLYCIQNTVTNQFYLGKKQFRNMGKKSSKHYGKEMSWRTYTGSSTHLNNDIKKYGHDKFKFVIIDVYKTRSGLSYAEAFVQMLVECMTTYLEDGKTPRWYNRQVAAIRFVTKETPTERTRNFIKNVKRKY